MISGELKMQIMETTNFPEIKGKIFGCAVVQVVQYKKGTDGSLQKVPKDFKPSPSSTWEETGFQKLSIALKIPFIKVDKNKFTEELVVQLYV